MSENNHARRVRGQDCNPRFDLVLTQVYPGWSRRFLKQLLREKKVRLNGQLAKTSSLAREGDLVELELPPISNTPTRALSVIHESNHFIYLYKASGVHVVAKYPGQGNTIATALREQFPQCVKASEDPRDGGAIHRLDAQTSGVLAVAKDADAYRRGRIAMHRGGLLKQYLATLSFFARTRNPNVQFACKETKAELEPELAAQLKKHFAAWTHWVPAQTLCIDAPLGKGARADQVAVSIKGRPCRSSLRVLAQRRGQELRRLVLLTLHTGMRHQLRAHMACLGQPIAHDPIYGHLKSPSHRLALHAWRLDLGDTDPGCGPITAPVASDFVKASEAGSCSSEHGLNQPRSLTT